MPSILDEYKINLWIARLLRNYDTTVKIVELLTKKVNSDDISDNDIAICVLARFTKTEWENNGYEGLEEKVIETEKRWLRDGKLYNPLFAIGDEFEFIQSGGTYKYSVISVSYKFSDYHGWHGPFVDFLNRKFLGIEYKLICESHVYGVDIMKMGENEIFLSLLNNPTNFKILSKLDYQYH